MITKSHILKSLSLLVGFLLWFPAIGITIGSYTFQMLEIISPVLLLGFLINVSNFFYKKYLVMFQILLLVSISWLVSYMFSEAHEVSIEYLIYHFVFIFPFVSFIALAFLSYESRSKFINGFLSGALLTCFIVVYQRYIDFDAISNLRNNANFSLSSIRYWDRRPTAFLPEVSTLAQLLCTAFGISIIKYIDYRKSRPFLSKKRIENTCLVLLLAISIFSLNSTLAFGLMPFALFIAFKISGIRLTRFFLIILVATPALIFIVNTMLQSSLNERGQIAIESSIMNRSSSILGAFYSLPEIWVTGVGLGNNDAISEYAEYAKIKHNLSFQNMPTGINSFYLSRIFEEGILAFCTFGLMILGIIKSAKNHTRYTHQTDREILTAGVILLVPFLLVSGYRGFYHLWLIMPISIFCLASIKNKNWRLDRPTQARPDINIVSQ